MKKNSFIKYAEIVGTVIFDIFALFITLSVFNVAQTHFENVALSLLICIFININVIAGIYMRNTDITMASLHEHLLRMRKELRNASTDSEEEHVTLLKNKLQENALKFCINLVFSVVILLIATFHLLTNL